MKYDDEKLGKLFEKYEDELKDSKKAGTVTINNEEYIIFKQEHFHNILERITDTVKEYIEEYKE